MSATQLLTETQEVKEAVHTAPQASPALLPEYNPASEKTGETVLYLAYGSNLSAEKFVGARKIKPLSATNVLVPALEVVFDLPGVPYLEPCFANTRFRPGYDPNAPQQAEISKESKEYLRTATARGWQKGLVGVVYEVTATDYVKIIATEGAGMSYKDIEVDCFKLERGIETVPERPTGASFKAHTLYASLDDREEYGRRSGWAEPSPRYKKLLTDGAEENRLPQEYRDWMDSLQAYHPVTFRQRLGRAAVMATIVPVVLMIFALQKRVIDDKGHAPKWMHGLVSRVFGNVWWTYDHVYKPVFGDGERSK